jgi:hypothetical protein
MSLDLYHLKAVAEPVDLASFIPADKFPEEAFSKYGFDRFVRTVLTTEVLHTVYFIPDSAAYNWSIARRDMDGSCPQCVSYLQGTPESCETRLMELEAKLGLDRSLAWFSNARRLRNGRWLKERFALYSRPVAEKGVYYIEAGHQCDGISEEFCRKYQRHILVDKSSFEDLRNFLGRDAQDAANPDLMQDFVGNYVSGSSFLWLPG